MARQARHVAALLWPVNAHYEIGVAVAPRCRLGAPISNLPPAGREIGAGEGNRTLVVSLEGFCSAIELHPPAHRQCHRRDKGVNRRA